MPARSLALAGLLAAVLPAATTLAAPYAGAAGRRGVVRVAGVGSVSVRPDVAIVHAGIEVSGEDLSEAVGQASAAMRRVLATLGEAGIPERDVRTTRHDVRVQRAWKDGQEGEITGYTVAEEVRVVVRELAKLSAVLDRAVAAGANVLRGLSFEKDDPTQEQREALGRAVAQARAKAEAIAKASGVTLGDVLEIAEVGAGAPIPFERARVALQAADGAPVSPGELEISARVEATYALR
jgi:uncharacterized protein YggE